MPGHLAFKTTNDLDTHTHSTKEESECTVCEKTFENLHSLKQHTATKHNNTSKIPVDSEKQMQSETMEFKCVKCFRIFSNGKDIHWHMREHIEEQECGRFQETKNSRMCRYFRQGLCAKGKVCNFAHPEGKSYTPRYING